MHTIISSPANSFVSQTPDAMNGSPAHGGIPDVRVSKSHVNATINGREGDPAKSSASPISDGVQESLQGRGEKNDTGGWIRQVGGLGIFLVGAAIVIAGNAIGVGNGPGLPMMLAGCGGVAMGAVLVVKPRNPRFTNPVVTDTEEAKDEELGTRRSEDVTSSKNKSSDTLADELVPRSHALQDALSAEEEATTDDVRFVAEQTRGISKFFETQRLMQSIRMLKNNARPDRAEQIERNIKTPGTAVNQLLSAIHDLKSMMCSGSDYSRLSRFERELGYVIACSGGTRQFRHLDGLVSDECLWDPYDNPTNKKLNQPNRTEVLRVVARCAGLSFTPADGSDTSISDDGSDSETSESVSAGAVVRSIALANAANFRRQ